MQSNSTGSMPLIGALFVAEGLVTQEQMEACLLLQAQDYPNMPLGQIMLRCGYITVEDLLRVVHLQDDLKDSMIGTLEASSPSRPATDLIALLLCRQKQPALISALLSIGVASTSVLSLEELKQVMAHLAHDVILIDSSMLQEAAALPETTKPILLVPPLPLDQNGIAGPLSPELTLLARQFSQVRALRRQEHAFDQLNQREYELGVVSTISRLMAAQRSPREAINHLMFMIRNLFNVEAGTLYRMDHKADQLVFEVVFGPNNEMLQQQRLPADRGIAGWVVRHGEPLLIPDASRDHRFESTFDRRTGFQTSSVLCVPLTALGKVRGVLQLINKLDSTFTERDLLLLRIIASLGALADILVSLEEAEELQLGSPSADSQPPQQTSPEPPPIRSRSLRTALRRQTDYLMALDGRD